MIFNLNKATKISFELEIEKTMKETKKIGKFTKQLKRKKKIQNVLVI